MAKVESCCFLFMVDGVTYQAAFPKHVVNLMAKQTLAMLDEFDGKLINCNFADLQPLDCKEFPFEIGVNDD